MKWKILMLLADYIIITQQSIAGITYHDDYSFDNTYRDVRECDPFYWHPLHLPEHCAEIFANLMRSRVTAAAQKPVRIVTKKRHRDDNIYPLQHFYNRFGSEYSYPMYNTQNRYHGDYDDDSIEEIRYKESVHFSHPYSSAYEKMLDFLRKDISKTLVAPTVEMSNYGPVSVYKQPVSKKSKHIINKIARAYAKANQVKDTENSGYFYGQINIPQDTKKDIKNKNNSNVPKNQVENIFNK